MTTKQATAHAIDALRILEDAYAYYPGNAAHQRIDAKRSTKAPEADLGRYA
ncbi:hypothetical protein FIU97_01360 [Roseivivax sp. THAF40]|uniref:hypothetical protein n=1 Tax=unclassified Roseivivax TaxID=2639302 RepID=UPI0012A890C6|nr:MULTISPECIES: hypothetical protein [unclassified Roseivivax]QFS81481.1 hypothetical protein FIV09_01450 [Roseivivax sp. THAF197b]QFT45210.1 hypothetical protein FIU97_01360 [Roseivivax sp. THAF40]